MTSRSLAPRLLLPDYYNDPSAQDTGVFSLATNLAKWDATGRMAERNHHHIHGVELHPDGHKQLISVQVVKTAPGYLVFWEATGVAKFRLRVSCGEISVGYPGV